MTSFDVKRWLLFRAFESNELDESKIDELVALVGVLGMELPPNIGRIFDLNDVERVNIKLVPPVFDSATRRFGGGDGGGKGTPGKSALP